MNNIIYNNMEANGCKSFELIRRTDFAEPELGSVWNVISVLRTLTLNEKNTSRNKAEAVLVSIILLWSTGTMQRALQRAVNRWASTAPRVLLSIWTLILTKRRKIRGLLLYFLPM